MTRPATSIASDIDHIAIAVRDVDAAYRAWRERHGVGRVTGSSPARVEFTSRQLVFGSRTKLELIGPSAHPGTSFIDDYLARFGPGIHHITLKVAAFEAALASLGEAGVDVVDVDRRRLTWLEAFVSPRRTGGPIVQVACSLWTDEQFSHAHGLPIEPATLDADHFHGAVLTHPDLADARRLWSALGADVHDDGRGILCSWGPGSLNLWIRPADNGDVGLVVGPPDAEPNPDEPLKSETLE